MTDDAKRQRWPDWATLDRSGRGRVLEISREIAGALQDTFHAFVEIAPERPVGSGPLAGLPYAVKDMMVSALRRPGCGLPEGVDLATREPARVLQLLDAAGASLVGFAAMTPLAYEPSGAGTARNPWNPAFMPGGSSSGPAVAVATGAAVLALGSDTGGSVRIPAQACGVTAWKPTPGLIPTDGTMPLSPSLDTIGPLARGAADIIAAAAVLTAGRVAVPAGPAAPAIAVAEDAVSASEEPVARAVRGAADVLDGLARGRPRVQAMEVMRQAGDEALSVMQAEAWRCWSGAIERGRLDPVFAKRLAKGRDIDDAELAASLERRRGLAAEASERLFRDADVVVLPVMPLRTPPLSQVEPGSPAFTPRTLYAVSAFTRFANYLGLPGVALPVGFDDRGMPVAMQLVGRPGTDATLLAMARAYQSETDWHGRIPVEAGSVVAPALARL